MARCAALAASLLLLWVAPSAAADPAPLLLYYSSATADDSRAAVEGVARRNGTAFLDLSPVDPPPPKAGQYLNRAIDAYHDLKYDTALAQIDLALAEVDGSGGAGLTTSELSDLFLYRALVVTEQGDSPRAWDDLVRAAALDPTRKLDPVRFSPRSAEAFQRAVDAVNKAERAVLSVEAPAGCKVFVDGRALDPAQAQVPIGEHFVRVTCEGSVPYGARVVVSEPQQTVVPVLAPPKTVDINDAAKLVERRGGTAFIVALVDRSPGADGTLAIRLYDVATVSAKGSVIVGLDGDISAAVQRLIDQVVRPTVIIREVPQKIPWYKKPWVWGVAGAAVTGAILLPFVLESNPATDFGVDLRFP